MKGSDIFYTFIIILIFIALYLFNVLSIGISKIKKDWPKYRCNPSVMPFAGYFGHSSSENFTYCVQNMQTDFMSYLLQPTNYAISVLGDSVTSAMNDIQNVRRKIADFAGTISDAIMSIFSIFMNILIQFQRMIIKLKSVFGKLLGTLATVLYLIEGGMLTGTSIMAGPVGGTLRFLCFHPDTNVHMENGIVKPMKSIEPGEILSNGSVVLASLKIVGNEHDPSNAYYTLYDSVHDDVIYVTGSHKIHDRKTNRFIEVRHHEEAEKSSLTSSHMSCLVTDDHLIRLGEYTFWDWED